MGADDSGAASSADQLVRALPQATGVAVPGDHWTAAGSPELVTTMADFLAGHRQSPGAAPVSTPAWTRRGMLGATAGALRPLGTVRRSRRGRALHSAQPLGRCERSRSAGIHCAP
ncbi:hypothetical protein [Streptomyces sp. NPDC054783]